MSQQADDEHVGAGVPVSPKMAERAAVNGALVIDKPEGLTSHDIVAAVRRTLAGPRVGHAGTLDPLATGVLPLLIGRATRLARFAAGATKTYEARIRFGWTTDTCDATGRPTGPAVPVTLNRAGVEEALAAFRGTFLQRPPAYSARKVNGRRAYTLARRDIAPDLQSSLVTVHELHLTDVGRETVSVQLTVSAGFYVRALASDLGAALGVGGFLEALRRIRSGEFHLGAAVAFSDVAGDRAAVVGAIIPMHQMLVHLPAIRLDAEQVTHARHGRDLAASTDITAEGGTEAVRLLGPDGSLVGVGEPTETPGVLHPSLVLV